jgi:hypothetical protein
MSFDFEIYGYYDYYMSLTIIARHCSFRKKMLRFTVNSVKYFI